MVKAVLFGAARVLPVVLLLASMAEVSIGQKLNDGYPSKWDAPRLYELIFSTEQLGREERAVRFIDWMQSNDWQAIECELCDLYNLYDKINLGVVPYESFSARWSGSVVAPKSGEYTICQAKDFSGRDNLVRVYIGGALVLDTSQAAKAEVKGEVESCFKSTPARLTAGRPAEITVELVHDVIAPASRYGGGAPMVLLSWGRRGASGEIIPASAFSPPDGFGPAGASGLRGEYFADTRFGESATVRLDTALDLICTSAPAVLRYEEAEMCLQRCIDRLLDDTFLAESAQNGMETVFDYNLWRVAYRMTASERQRLVDLLLASPEVVEQLSLRSMARLYQAIYMLPSGDQVRLLGEWSLTHSQPKAKAGLFPGWSEGSYQEQNTDFYWLAGLFMQGPYWEQAVRLWDEYLELPSGGCNLPIAYITAYATRHESRHHDARFRSEFFDRVQGRLDDPAVTGDARVTWLLAKAFGKEVMDSETPALEPDSEELQEARLVAQSDAVRSWVAQEVAVRLAALGRVDDLDDLVQSVKSRTPEQQASVLRWRSVAASQVVAAEERRRRAAAQSTLAFIAELERRRDRAQRAGNSTVTTRYNGLLNRIQTDEE
ncbi:MAG: PA14 domain-containing protein [Myxococcota bacterium]